MDDLVERFLSGDRRALARIISRVENETPEGREYLRELFPHSGKTHIIGITGGAGSGKSNVAAMFAELGARVIERIEHLAEGFLLADPKAVVIVDAALLYEAGYADRFNKIIVAWSRPEQQMERLMARMRLTREQAEARIAAQMPAEEKRRRADYLIDCSGDVETTRQQVGLLYPQLKALPE